MRKDNMNTKIDNMTLFNGRVEKINKLPKIANEVRTHLNKGNRVKIGRFILYPLKTALGIIEFYGVGRVGKPIMF